MSEQAKANAIAQGIVNSDGTINQNKREKIRKRLDRTYSGNTFWSALNPFDARPYKDADRASAAASAYAATTETGYAENMDSDAVDAYGESAAAASDNLDFFGFIK